MAFKRFKSRRFKLSVSASLVILAATGYFLYSVFAVQGQGALAQAPLNSRVQVAPGFIMAVDNSGSMTFHNQFPASDGYGCWSSGSFFSSPGNLRVSGGTCSFAYSYTGPRIGTGYLGIPPVDTFGFARSPDFNPSYLDPEITYLPWLNADGSPYGSTVTNPAGNASITATRLDPRNASPTLNLASQYEEAGNERSRFNLRDGMFLPAGTRYRLSGNNSTSCGGLSNGGSSGWRTVGSGGRTANGNCTIYISYWPATFYLRETTPNTAPTIAAAGYENITPVRIPDSCGNGCHLWRYTITSTDTVALQNFANWFSFYGNRNRAMIAGMTRSMASVNNMYVGYFRINDHASWDEPVTKANERVAIRDMAVQPDRVALYDQMHALNASGGTPNRQAVMAAGEQFRRTDDDGPVRLACQRNAMMLFTDGFSNNGGPTLPNPQNRDGGMGVPFSDSHSNTMADIAASFYLNDSNGNSPIRPDLPAGLVPVPGSCPSSDPKINCQDNLHVNFYGITLGGRGNLYDPDNVLDPYTTPSIYQNWPSRQNDNRSTIDDIWHAAVNTRGEFVNARTPADITAAMRRILAAVSAGSTPSGTIALTGARIGTGSLSVEPFYAVENEGTDWFSRLDAYTVESDPLTQVVTFTPAWEASERFPAHGSRNIRFGTGSGTQAFDVANISDFDTLCDSPLIGMSRCSASEFGAGATQLNVTINDAVDYLRGDTSREVRNGGVLRDRTTLLGNIVNSTPVVSAPRDDYGYRSLSGFDLANTLASTYASYLTNKRAQRNVMVYVGANAGMLHAFDGGMGDDGVLSPTTGGVERFGFIPQSVLGYMGNLLFPYVEEDGGDQKFDHRYFVDGPLTVSDAHYDGSWSTVLVGTTGAGGRSVFALDVSNASRSSTPSFGSGDFLWEINSINASLPLAVRQNIGNVLGRPVIVPVRSGDTVTWKAIFGNGFNSQGGKAVLFVVDIDSGTPTIRMIEANESGAPSGTNGLGNIVVLDRFSGAAQDDPGRDGFADTVYAADQKGAIWRFDLASDANEVTTPVFVTQPLDTDPDYRQPITGGLTAAAGPAGGVMIYFGTGSFAFTNDPSDESIQSLYGVLDHGLSGTMTKANLLEQTVVSTDTVTGIREVSRNAMVSGRRGWFLDLPAGERFVGYPRIESGIVFMPTYAPTELDGCSTQGFNWLFGLNALSGAASLSNVSVGSPGGDSPGLETGAVALDTGGTAPVRDVAVMTAPRLGTLPAGSDPDDLDDALAAQCSMLVQVAGAPPLYLPRACGRQSWRQLL